jgi:hypothetical protein
MNERSSAPARVIAAAAVLCGFLVVIAIFAASLEDGGSGDGSDRSGKATTAKSAGGDRDDVPKSYVVQNGDTLTSIAHENGVSVARIQELNPGVDPQILVSGEKLKLR